MDPFKTKVHLDTTPCHLANVPTKFFLAEGKGLIALRFRAPPQFFELSVRLQLTEPKGSHPSNLYWVGARLRRVLHYPLSPCPLANVTPKLEPGGGEGIDCASLQGSALIKVEGTR